MEAFFNPPAELRRFRFIGLVSGLLAGLLNAVIARLLMRGIAVFLLGQRGGFSLGGTSVIFMYGTLVGTLFGQFYASYFANFKFPAFVRGLIFFLVLAVAIQIPVLALIPDFRAELMVAGTLGFAAFGLMNLAFCLSVAGIHAWLDQTWLRDDSRQSIEQSAVPILTVVAVIGLLLFIFGLGSEILKLLI